MSLKLTQPVKWHGGKRYLASKIVSMLPRHLSYVEPYCGGAAVLLERDPNDKRLWVSEKADRAGVSEVLNDINGELMNFWNVLRDDEFFSQFQRQVQAIPLAREAFEDAAPSIDPVNSAVHFFVRARQSLAGRFKGFTSLTRSRTRRGINGNASEWLGAVEGLPAIHERLRVVVLENMDALKLIRREDTENTFFYLDPPYLHSTRVSTDAYAHEMTREQHEELLALLAGIKGKFILSGYHSDLYDRAAEKNGWTVEEIEMPNHAASGEQKRRMTECLHRNY